MRAANGSRFKAKLYFENDRTPLARPIAYRAPHSHGLP
jgi:hypothetical protein